MEYVSIEVAIAGMDTKVFNSLGAAIEREITIPRQIETKLVTILGRVSFGCLPERYVESPEN